MLTNILIGILIILVVILLVMVSKKGGISTGDIKNIIDKSNDESARRINEGINSNNKLFNDMVSEKISIIDTNLSKSQEALRRSVAGSISRQEERLKTFSVENEQKLENIRSAVEKSLSNIQNDNNKKLDEMRNVVDEKLQKSLEDKMNKSFALVSERLEQVYKGLGEMQNLASGVGDLKKVLSNVKTRGILGEVQLSAILQEILSPEQYGENVEVVPESNKRVEFAIKLPGNDEGTVYLPIDSKFPCDRYQALLDAYDMGDREVIAAAVKALMAVIESEAKDISIKYIAPPYTTNFAIMFLPFEGLYSEVVNRGMIEVLQSKYKVNVAGPSTMAALLNSLQMGFKTLAIQKRSVEVWNTLAAVKTEFGKFADALDKTKKHLEMASDDLERLVTTRTRAMRRKLSSVEALSDSAEADKILEVSDEE
ncbi:MAG: DNA recombination protein RmuC [Clostridia bacterium]|nr:DNA recombination protein RmuC [Clostridia bacterium]